ncbi:MAG: nucleotide exchange factor GrpE [Candidatus Bathyarchaeota archaeon]|nr:nucleotide exchange factor GrpE [Candidatus Bathyarchaeota archaeon]
MEKEQARNQSEEREEHLARSEETIEENGTLELVNALKKEKKRSEDYLNRLKYMQADFENLKKRQDRELEEIRKYSNERLILELLGIVDELELAIQESKQTQSVKVLLKGVEITLKKLKKVLELEQVSPIDCIGQAFDPSKHEVIARIESEEEGKIIEEIRKGYTLKGKVIRPSIVKIAVNPASESHQEEKSR